ncbi:hypothetical protein chiPu_0021116, partial [Chiloscyllium punctatum]|nr:hypothetical protein [Chiloscyllium punctatum]
MGQNEAHQVDDFENESDGDLLDLKTLVENQQQATMMMGVILGAGVAMVLIATTILIVHRRLQER